MKPSNIVLVLSLALAAPLALADAARGPVERKLYVGTDSTEAVMTFKGTVLYTGRTLSEQGARKKIEKQIEHFFGPMGEARYKAVPRGNHEITNVVVTAGKITYNYKGTIVLQNGPTDTYEIIMPVNPDAIYAAGMVGDHNPCTDHHYQSEGDFWYFWNPKNAGCKLKAGKDYVAVTTRVKRIENTKKTFPEYDRMADQTNTIRIHLLMGQDHPDGNNDPNTSRDINADNYRQIHKTFEGMGFAVRKLADNEIRKVVPRNANLPWVEELVKETKRAKIVVTMFFGPSGFNEDSTAFHYYFRDGVENAAITMYAGHSGLGGHLDLPSIERMHGFKFAPNPNRYQILYFNSCSSYTYYNTMFFDRKKTSADPKGTKNLDIITNGLATYFHVMPSTNVNVVKAVVAWGDERGTVSYQQLAKQNDSDNLLGINGDEDNPTAP